MPQDTVDAILEEIGKERERQRGMWSKEFDSRNTPNDWLTYMVGYLAKGTRWHPDRPDFDKVRQGFRENLVKVATLAVAAIESVDYNGGPARRHYDCWKVE